MAEALTDLSGALARAGRFDDAAKSLEEAETIQRALKNDVLQAAILSTQGDIAFYRGDLKNASQLYDAALRLASRTKANEETLLSKLNVAKIRVAQGQFQEALRTLEALLNTKGAINANLSLEISLAKAQSEIGEKNYAACKPRSGAGAGKRAAGRSPVCLARIYYLLGTSVTLSGSDGRAGEYYTEAASSLDAIRTEPGAEKIMNRTDFKAMYDESNRWKK